MPTYLIYWSKVCSIRHRIGLVSSTMIVYRLGKCLIKRHSLIPICELVALYQGLLRSITDSELILAVRVAC
jgi:hypothetical protein